jgi:CubicO group peptidase (beta-lactamase class C family)
MIPWRGTARARVLAGCVVLLAVVGSQTVPSPPKDIAVRDATMAYMRETGVVGCSVAIAEKGRIVYSSGFGFADLENPAEARPETLFRLASISKPITAVAVMKLVERGLVDLKSDIRQYVPEFPDKGQVITVEQVLNHTSGIRHYKGDEFASTKRYDSVLDSLKIFQDDPLVHVPGQAYTYTTYGYTLLARLIENVSKVPFPDFVRDEVFLPAGMAASRVDDATAIIPNRAKGYREGPDKKAINSNFADTSYKWAGGGMLSTAPDMARFGISLLAGTLLSRDSVARMWTTASLPDGRLTRYGLGFHVNQLEGRRLISHTGSQQGTQTAMLIFPEEQVVIVVLTNYESHRAMDLARRISEAWLGIDAKAPLAGAGSR